MRTPKLAKVIAMALTAVLILSLAACGDKLASSQESSSTSGSTGSTQKDANKAIDQMGKYDPGITVSTVKAIDDVVQKLINLKSDVLTDNIWSRAYESELGIKVDYIWTAAATQFEQKMNVSISANDLPDIIPVSARQLKLLVDSDIVLDLSDLFKDYATPFTNEMMKADNNISLSQATFDGKLMALPHVSGNRDSSNMLWIRADWLKNLNLQAPKTMQDVLKIAEAFTKNDPDKNGKNDTFGFGLEKNFIGAGFGQIDGFMEGYHAYVNGGWIKDSSGNLVYGGIQPEVKTALAQLAEMYKANQIDREFTVKDGSKLAESVVAGKVGMLYGQHWLPFYPFQDAKNKDPKADWKAYPIVSADDKPALTMVSGSAAVGSPADYYVVNKKMKNPEAAVKLYNYYYAKDPALSKDFDPKFHGINGEMETKPDQHYELAAMLSFYPMQNLYIHQQVKKYFETKDESILQNYWAKDNIEQNQKYLAGDNKYYSAYAWSGTEGSEGIIDYYDKNGLMLQNVYIKADTDTMMQKGATLKQLRDETFTKIIIGISPVSDFDKYVDQWHKLGGDEITREVNAAK